MSSSKPRDVGKGVKSEGNSAVANTQIRTDVLFNPDTASCEGNSTICLVFDETAESLISGSSRVEICVRTSEKSDRLAATQVNERTFSFLAPANREGDATAVVFVDETEVASTYLRYRSDTVHLVNGVSQIYLQFLSTACRYMFTLQTKHQIPSPILELDRLLAKTFEDKDNKYNIPPIAFEELFDILRHSSADVVQSMYDIPTLLHLSGEYGLVHLVIGLMDLPGAIWASNLFNHNGRTASELANNNGYLHLAKTLSASTKNGFVEKYNGCELPENAASDLDDGISAQQQHPSSKAASGKPPPSPCQKFILRKMLTTCSIPESQAKPPALPPRSSVRAAAPPLPRRESRDSGVNIDVNNSPSSCLTTARKRPPLTRGDTEPIFVNLPIRRSNQGTAGNTVQRNFSISGEEIARQLKKPVQPQPGVRGSSVTK